MITNSQLCTLISKPIDGCELKKTTLSDIIDLLKKDGCEIWLVGASPGTQQEMR